MDVSRHDPHSRLRQLINKASGALARRRARPGSVSRRNFLHVGALAGAGASWSGAMAPAQTSQSRQLAGIGSRAGYVQRSHDCAIAGGDAVAAHDARWS